MDFNYLRRKSIFDSPSSSVNVGGTRPFDFSQGEQEDTPSNPTTNSQTSNPGLMEAYSQLAKMEPGPAQQKYKDFLDTQPNREDYKPSKMQRLSAVLAGASEGIRNGGARGYLTANGILDSDYNDAMSDFKVKGDRLSSAASLEEKDMNNRVKTYRDFLQDKEKSDDLIRKGKLDDSTIARNNAYVGHLSAQDQQLKNAGWTKSKNASTGVESYTRVNPATGEFESKPIGKMDLNPSEQVDLFGRKAGAASNATIANNIKIAQTKGDEARKTMQTKFEGIQAIVKFKNEHPDWKSSIDSDGQLIYTNPKDPSAPPVYTGIDTGKMSDQDKIDAGIKAKIKLKEAPSAPKPGSTTTTKIVNGQKVVTTVPNQQVDQNNPPPPAGAKPGGKWIKTTYGMVYQEP